MNNPTYRKITAFLADNLFYVVIVPLTGYLIYCAIATLEWRIYHDSSALMYCAYLINDLGYVPYRDFFAVQMPGTFHIFSLIGGLFDFSDLGFRITDLFFLGVITTGTWLILRKVDWRVAWVAPVIFGILYFGEGPKMSLEREYVMLPFVIFAVVSAVSFDRLPYNLRSFLIGVFFGMAALIKPTVLIGFPVVLVYNLVINCKGERRKPYSYIVSAVISIAGIALPVLVAFVYLWRSGALPYFIDIVTNYWPLFRDISGLHQLLSGVSKLNFYLLSFRSFGHYGLWVVIATVNTISCLTLFKVKTEQKRMVILLIALAVAFYVYPSISGQFYFYHWLPFVYFVVLLSSLCFVKPPKRIRLSFKLLPVSILVLACIISFKLPFGGFRNIYGDFETEEPWGGRADEIAVYLDNHLEPGDTVQPLDWVCGTAHGLLIARAELATRFIYDFHFYHHISEDYIRGLRADFIAELEEERPRFIVEIPMDTFTRCSGPDTSQEFPEIRSFIASEYIEVASGDGYIIYERLNAAH